MSLSDGTPMMTMPVAPTGMNNSGFGGFGDGNGWWIILFFIILFGWNGNGRFGNNGSSTGGVMDGYVLTSDFANIERKLDSISNGICDSTFALNNGINGVNLNVNNGFMTAELSRANQQAALMQQLTAMQMQSQQCCCETNQNIERNTTQGIMNTNALQSQISSCCCDIEKMNMQNRYDAQANACSTLQAIDKLGDRIIDYMNADKTQTLRDENFALRLQASQAAQNNYLLSQLHPSPVPSYTVQNPYCCYQSCGCNG